MTQSSGTTPGPAPPGDARLAVAEILHKEAEVAKQDARPLARPYDYRPAILMALVAMSASLWLPELPFLEIGGICLTDDALIFSYTDGLTDIRNKSGEEFGEEHLIPFLQSNAHHTAKEINTLLLNHIESFREREPYPDDITVLTCKVFK